MATLAASTRMPQSRAVASFEPMAKTWRPKTVERRSDGHDHGQDDHQPDARAPGGARTAAGDLAMSSLTQVRGASIFWLWAIHLATPRAMPIIPRVTMNGTSRRRVISRPLTRPTRAPVRTPRRTARRGGSAGVDGVGGDDAGQGDVGGGREVDAAADDDQGHAQGAQGHDDRLGGDGS